jgi:hypothetical protein
LKYEKMDDEMESVIWRKVIIEMSSWLHVSLSSTDWVLFKE